MVTGPLRTGAGYRRQLPMPGGIVTGHSHHGSVLLADRCPLCHRPGGAPCAECRELFSPLGRLPPPPGLAALFAAVAYDDASRPLVTALKYRRQRAATSWMADAMVAVLPPGRPDLVTWAPTSAARRRERGFDQAELLARAVSRRMGVPPRRLLRRGRGESQTGRGAHERRTQITPFRPAGRCVGASVLLVDDVVTTGSTLEAAAAALGGCGVARVVGLVAAATPAPRGSAQPVAFRP